MREVTEGFTLIELIIVVAIIGTLAAITYPSYMEHVRRAQRVEIAGLLSEAAQQFERHYSRAGQYTDTDTVMTANPAGNAFYTVTTDREEQAFTLTAAPITGKLMAGDRCASFAISHTGARTNPNASSDTSTAACWGR